MKVTGVEILFYISEQGQFGYSSGAGTINYIP